MESGHPRKPYVSRRGKQVRQLHLAQAPAGETEIARLKRELGERTTQLELAVASGRRLHLIHKSTSRSLRKRVDRLTEELRRVKVENERLRAQLGPDSAAPEPERPERRRSGWRSPFGNRRPGRG